MEKQHGIELAPRVGAAERSITGHIDFLQVRNGAVHILDYKPDARTNKPIAQLAIYALALTRLVPGLKLFDIKCAWFNEEEYCEFFPTLLFQRSRAEIVYGGFRRDRPGRKPLRSEGAKIVTPCGSARCSRLMERRAWPLRENRLKIKAMRSGPELPPLYGGVRDLLEAGVGSTPCHWLPYTRCRSCCTAQ